MQSNGTFSLTSLLAVWRRGVRRETETKINRMFPHPPLKEERKICMNPFCSPRLAHHSQFMMRTPFRVGRFPECSVSVICLQETGCGCQFGWAIVQTAGLDVSALIRVRRGEEREEKRGRNFTNFHTIHWQKFSKHVSSFYLHLCIKDPDPIV